ncbi:threonine synthase [Agaribacterium sp. ZY112]|uniref:threonine synthase n=1 Tax=Agaribacterium sp. ZY112 TaxID=3233574 RepID=UPI0035261FC6
MKYVSTRGQAPALEFEDVVLTGLASDGGLYVPETIPEFSQEEIASWAGLSYQELALKVMSSFVAGSIPEADLKDLIDRSYSTFRHQAIVPMVQTGHNEWILELFQGPTLAFKDVALQFLGNLLDYVLKKRDQKVVIMGATSGDTGSAAIEGCRHCDNVDIFILHPYQRVSDVQRRQMTTVIENNVHNIAMKGNFDDCQNLVKASFADQSFLPEGRQLAAVNSINWARIMAQIVYYFYAGLSVGSPARKVSFSVPTGNFGDIFAGYIAKRMGLPVDQLVIATNSNDILHRCISNNDHSKKALEHTLSPSMDIMMSSNFERMLFELYDRDGAKIAELMEDFKSGSMTLGEAQLSKARELFSSYRLGDDEMIDVIRDVFENCEYLVDPHTAIGVEAARKTRRNNDVPMICLATAHPAKFPEAVKKAGQKEDPALPHHMSDLFDREEKCEILDHDAQVVRDFVASNCRA